MPDGTTPAGPATLFNLLSQLETALRSAEFPTVDELAVAMRLIDSAKKLAVESPATDDISVDDALVADVSNDTIHRAMCMQWALAEWQSHHEDETSGPQDDDLRYGRWLLNTTVTQLLRVAKAQMAGEYRSAQGGAA